MFVKIAENCCELTLSGGINLDVTLDCGQAFRWKRNSDGSWTGVVRGVEATVKKDGDERLLLYGVSGSDAEIFADYFDAERDYGEVLSSLMNDKNLARAVSRYGTIRILRQEPWEALCSFIISSCNNIPRIKGIIERFCANFGEKSGDSYAFPSAEKTVSLSAGDLEVLRAGYRAPYILSAAEAVAGGEINLSAMYSMTVEECEKELTRIRGVGKKVADCTALFGLGHIDAFPVDRHIKRICGNLYPDGLPECTRGIEGIAQQYMFYIQRTGAV